MLYTFVYMSHKFHGLINVMRPLHLIIQKNRMIDLILELRSSLSNAAETRDDITYTRTHIIYTPESTCKINWLSRFKAWQSYND